MRSGREAILKAAIRLFAQKGYAGTSTREICQLAGITKPVLYYHFRSKERLYETLMVQIFREGVSALIAAARQRGTLRRRLIRLIDAEFQDAKADTARIQFALRMIFAPEEERPNYNYMQEMERERELLTDMFQESIDAGQIRGNAKELATALMSMNIIAILEHSLTSRSILTRRRAERHVDMILRSCAVD